MMRVFCNVVLIIFLATLIRAAKSDGDSGVDRPYGDLPGMPLSLPQNAQPHDCAAACSSQSGCVAWAYGVPNCSSELHKKDAHGLRGALRSSTSPLCWLKASVTNQVANSCRVSGVMGSQLSDPALRFLPLGSISPKGWLQNQLQIQADGLSGHLALFWPDIMQSIWIGGAQDGGLHERTPYWLNGIIPLAVQLNDSILLGQVENYVSYILGHQRADGWLGPSDNYDSWARFPLLLGLTQYAEAFPQNRSSTVDAMFKFLKCLQGMMLQTPLGDWAQARWQDLALAIQWLYDNEPRGQEMFLMDMIELSRQQGLDWNAWFGAEFPQGEVTSNFNLFTHGVNNGQALKSSLVGYRLSHNSSDIDSAYERVKKLDMYHGAASGVFNCDEHLAGLMPSHGTELCTVVEIMYSYEVMFAIIGDPYFAERAEQIAYNALSATFAKDMWAHQYIQQSNEINAMHSDPHLWITDGPDSNIYGLEPNYGCCTANFHQGWPKFTSSLFMLNSTDGGVVIANFAPASVQTSLPNGGQVSIDMNTNYPFEDFVTLDIVYSTNGDDLPIYLRMNSWAQGKICIKDFCGSIHPGQFNEVMLPGTKDNSTFASQSVEIYFTMNMRVTRRYNNSAAIYRGPFLYALNVQPSYTILANYTFDSKDYQLLPAADQSWNYALVLENDQTPESSLNFSRVAPTGPNPFDPAHCPLQITAQARLVPEWQIDTNSAAAPPLSPVTSTQPLTTVTLLPYGATKLRVAEIPTLSLSSSAEVAEL